MRQFAIGLLIVISLFPLVTVKAWAQTSFNFVVWGDTKSDVGVLKSLSQQIVAKDPRFTLYAGDLEENGFTLTGMNLWRDAVNGGVGNGLFNLTFPVRGNHDNTQTNSIANWQNYYNLNSQSAQIGATHYAFYTGYDDLTYSFDFGNSHFVAVDSPGDASTIITAVRALGGWLDTDLSAAELRGLTHAFLYWHGPVYPVDGHCCPAIPSDLISVLNKHPIVAATFHGHEHVLAYSRITGLRLVGITHEFDSVISGDAGAGPDTASSRSPDYWLNLNGANVGGYVSITVSGPTYTIAFYKGGQTLPVWTKLPADLTFNGRIDYADYAALIPNIGTNEGRGDIVRNGSTDIYDYSYILKSFGT